MAIVKANGKTYDSEDVTALINGIPIDLTEVTYGSEREFKVNYSLGSSKPTSHSRGKYSFTGSMSILMSDVTFLENGADGDLLNVAPFTINVSYLNKYQKIKVDKIIAVFTTQGREVNGDMGLQYTYELGVIDIQYDVA